jgi:hypothetical protein
VAVPIFLVPVIIMLRKSKLEEAVRIANGEEIQPSEAEAKPVAIVSLIMGIISVVSSCYGYFMGLGVVGLLGALLSRRYKKEGNGLAKAALIVSAVGIAVNVIGIIFMIKVEIPMTSGLDMEQLMQQIKDLQNMQ